MASKRPAADGEAGEPASKKKVIINGPINLGPISTEEELDQKVLKIQNARLYDKLEEKNSLIDDLKAKVSEGERLQKNDQTIISTLNKSWNQLDDHVRILLQRYEEPVDEDSQGMSETTVAFLEKLSNRTSKGIEEEVTKKENYSQKIIERLVKAIEKTFGQSQNIAQQIQQFNKRRNEASSQEGSASEDQASADEREASEEEESDAISIIELAIKQENIELKSENNRLHNLVTSLHDKHTSMLEQHSEMSDQLATIQKELTETSSKKEDMQYDLQKANHQVEKLIKKLSEADKTGSTGTFAGLGVGPSGAGKETDEVKQGECEELEELAKNRLLELETLQKSHVLLAEEYEKLKQSMACIPDDVIAHSTKFKVLQTQYNLLFNDATTIRKNCEEARRIVLGNRNQHIQQVEQLEAENLIMRKKVRAEVATLEKNLTETRKELELLKIEYEQNQKAHEQVGPMSKEMRGLINSLQNHNQQLKGEVQRYKKKLTESQTKLTQLEAKNEESKLEETLGNAEELLEVLSSPDISPRSDDEMISGDESESGTDDVRVLRTKLKTAREKRKEMKLLLDMYKGVSKETREKAELLKNVQKLKNEVVHQKAKLTAFTKDLASKSKKLADADASRQIGKLKETIGERDKQIANKVQEENALLAEMEYIGQAFEDMQDQNIRLVQQLREKDDANLKLMSERIKAEKIQKLIREEKEALIEKNSAMKTRHQSVEELNKSLDEREKVLQTAITNMEKEMSLRQQAVECHKRKAVEVGQQCQELMFKLEIASKQVEELKTSMVEKTNRLEEEAFKCNRSGEENVSLKKKLERAKKMEYLGASDEILVEEVKMYKNKLKCPCCNSRSKDAILTKCFHVFCFECLKTRYDTRQRKCPKCNATFGNNDFHKIYM